MRAITWGMVLILTACGHPSENAQNSEPSGYFDSYEVKWNQRTLSVCWETDSSSNNNLAYYQGIVRDAVTSQYQRVGFTFTGWTSCDAVSSANIRVWVDPYTWPKV